MNGLKIKLKLLRTLFVELINNIDIETNTYDTFIKEIKKEEL